MRWVLFVLGIVVFACAGDDESSSAGIFSDLRVQELTATGAVVRFGTSIETTCEVEYGLAADALTQRATDPSMSTSDPFSFDHDVPLVGLFALTTYYYRALARDVHDQVYRSETLSFSTLRDDTPAGMVNVAKLGLGATVTDRSSNFGAASDSEAWGINHAFDGDLGTEWASDGDGDGAWAQIDLGSERSISQLRFRSRKMGDGSSIIEQIGLTFDGTDFLGPFETPDPDQLYVFEINPAVAARSVRIDALRTTGGNTGAKEIQLLSPVP